MTESRECRLLIGLDREREYDSSSNQKMSVYEDNNIRVSEVRVLYMSREKKVERRDFYPESRLLESYFVRYSVPVIPFASTLNKW